MQYILDELTLRK